MTAERIAELEIQLAAVTSERDRYREALEKVITLSPAETHFGFDRVRFAEGLIEQLPTTHEGRGTWLLNYGVKEEAERLREENRKECLQRGDSMPTRWDAGMRCLIIGSEAREGDDADTRTV